MRVRGGLVVPSSLTSNGVLCSQTRHSCVEQDPELDCESLSHFVAHKSRSDCFGTDIFPASEHPRYGSRTWQYLGGSKAQRVQLGIE